MSRNPRTNCLIPSVPIRASSGVFGIAGADPETRRWSSRHALLALVIIFIALVAACSSDNRFLSALLADPMATYEADGLVLVHSDDRPRRTDLVTRKPITARVTRFYELNQPHNADQVFNDALAAAEAAGWDFGGRTPTESFGGQVVSASKPLDWGPAELTIGIGPTPGEPDSDIMLRLWIDE